MKKFFAEFKKFITRGNIVDMAVGVIVGSSFTAIVNGLSNNILKPLINWVLALVFGKSSFSDILTFLVKVEVPTDVLDESGNVIGQTMTPDLTQSIYIDWGAFLNAVLNFFIVAFVLFSIVKLVNRVREQSKEYNAKRAKKMLTKEDRKLLKAKGIKLSNKVAVAVYVEEKLKKAAEEAEKKKAEEAAKAAADRLANPTTEDLLKLILAEMKKDGAAAVESEEK